MFHTSPLVYYGMFELIVVRTSTIVLNLFVIRLKICSQNVFLNKLLRYIYLLDTTELMNSDNLFLWFC